MIDGLGDRDPFRIANSGQQTGEFESQIGPSADLTPLEAMAALGLAVPAEPEAQQELEHSLRVAERKFCWRTQGAGVFSGESVAETEFWTYMLRRFSAKINDRAGGGSTMVLQADQLFSPEVLMPSEGQEISQALHEAGAAVTTGASNLARAAKLVVEQTRLQEAEPVTFIVTVPEVPVHIARLMQFDSALRAENPSALAVYDQNWRQRYFGGNEHISEDIRAWESLRRRLALLFEETMTQSPTEGVPQKLRNIGLQTSPQLAMGLEYLYYKSMLAFADAGSNYREVPENVRIGLVVDKTMYTAMLARGLQDPYGTVKTWDPEAALGCHASIPGGDGGNATILDTRLHTLRHGLWKEDPLTPAMAAAFIYADAELPRLPAEDF